MTSITQPLHDEHQGFLPHIEALRATAGAVSDSNGAALVSALDDAIQFLTGTLVPHAAAEEQVLYREVEHVMGVAETTQTMRRDHEEIRTYIRELESLRSGLTGSALTRAQADDLRRLLYGLYAIVRLHLAKEEDIYFPLLDAFVSVEGAQDLLQRMELAAGEARSHPGPGE